MNTTLIIYGGTCLAVSIYLMTLIVKKGMTPKEEKYVWEGWWVVGMTFDVVLGVSGFVLLTIGVLS